MDRRAAEPLGQRAQRAHGGAGPARGLDRHAAFYTRELGAVCVDANRRRIFAGPLAHLRCCALVEALRARGEGRPVVVTIRGDGIGRARGGPRGLVMPMRRDPSEGGRRSARRRTRPPGRLRVEGELGWLRRVLVCSPGEELRRVPPGERNGYLGRGSALAGAHGGATRELRRGAAHADAGSARRGPRRGPGSARRAARRALQRPGRRRGERAAHPESASWSRGSRGRTSTRSWASCAGCSRRRASGSATR